MRRLPSFEKARRSAIVISGIAVATILVLAASSGAVVAGGPDQGAPGKVPPGGPALAPTPVKQTSAGRVGPLASTNLGTLNADFTCVGSNSAGLCDSVYSPQLPFEVENINPSIAMLNAHPLSGPTKYWYFEVGPSNDFFLGDGVGNQVPLRIDHGVPTNALRISTGGDVGLGTVPSVPLHIARNGSLRLRLEAISGSSARTDLWQGDAGLWFENLVGAATPTVPFKLANGAPDNALVVHSSGKVGIGTETPLTRLQVGSGSTGVATAGASLLTEEGIASSVIIKSTSGPEMFLYEDQNNGLMGTASNTPFGLRSNNQNRFWMTETGNVGIGTAFTNPVHLFQVGNSNGAFTDGSTWSNASSRSLKENFETTDGQSVLRKLVSLPVDSWNYKTDGAGIRHLGPTAEDFMATFGLGSTNTAISTVDADGVAMAAIKGLYEQVQAKDAKIADLESRIARLEAGGLGDGRPLSASSSEKITGPGLLLTLVASGAVAGISVLFGQHVLSGRRQ